MMTDEERPSTHETETETEMTEIQTSGADTEMQTPVESADVGASLPSPEEIIAEVNPRRKRKATEQVFSTEGSEALLGFFFAMVITLALSLGLGIGLANRNDDSKHGRRSTPAEIQNYVVFQKLSPATAFENEASPQYRAAQWMAEVDELDMNTPFPEMSLHDPFAYQFAIRYAMAVLYYSTQGENWMFQLNFMTNKETCAWNGLLEVAGGAYLSYGLVCNQKKQPLLLYLDNNKLSKWIPSELSVMSTLTVLDMNGNSELAGTIPDGICNIVELRSLAIAYTRVSGTLPDCLSKLDKMIFMTFSNSNMNGPLPTLKGMNNLQSLLLDDNHFSGDISKVFDEVPNLKFLSLDNNEFTGVVDSTFMQENTNLVQLDLSGNKLSGALPVHLFEYDYLWMIDLHGNSFSGQMPDFPVSPALRFLALHNNKFSGTIPASIANLQLLEHLDLASNKLSGNMTEEIGTLENLNYLFLANNTFETGTIPSSYANLVKLEEFSVKSTSRFGPIPDYIYTWQELQLLDLDGNSFDGNIPTTFGMLVKLEFLLLNDNLINGQVPDELVNLPNMRALFLEDNNMYGNITFLCETGLFSEEPGDNDGTEILVADCGPNGNIECSCCVCCNPDSSQGDAQLCNDHDLVTSLDPIWEASYSRAYYDFGNFTRFVDKDWLP